MSLSPVRSPSSKSMPLSLALALGLVLALVGCSTSGDLAGPEGAGGASGGPPGTAGAESDGGKPPMDPPPGAGFSCEVQALLATKCQVCHTDPPAGGATAPLMTVAQFLDWSKQDPTKLVAEVALAKMQDANAPMPPAFFNSPVSSADVAAFKAWMDGNYQGSCNGAVPVLAKCTTCHGSEARAGISGADTLVTSRRGARRASPRRPRARWERTRRT